MMTQIVIGSQKRQPKKVGGTTLFFRELFDFSNDFLILLLERLYGMVYAVFSSRDRKA